jgi:hypothetical protein
VRGHTSGHDIMTTSHPGRSSPLDLGASLRLPPSAAAAAVWPAGVADGVCTWAGRRKRISS